MSNLSKASTQLFCRGRDERFGSIEALLRHCRAEKERSTEQWRSPRQMVPEAADRKLTIRLHNNGSFSLNDWSFTQLCRHANVTKDVVNRLSTDTASRVLRETLPVNGKPIQLFALDERLRSLHGTSYSRLYNADLLTAVLSVAEGFQQPQTAANCGTGLYCGEQDMFCFLIDPTGWTEIGGNAFAPGFFLWNSEVGRRTVGIETFWFQAVCENHIVWDAIDVTEFAHRHTGGVQEALDVICRMAERLANRRDQRRDEFVQVISKAMRTRLGDDADCILETLGKHGISQALAKEALKVAEQDGAFTIFSVVDALTRLSQRSVFAADRAEADIKASRLLALAA